MGGSSIEADEAVLTVNIHKTKKRHPWILYVSLVFTGSIIACVVA